MCKLCETDGEVIWQKLRNFTFGVNGYKGIITIQRPYCSAGSGCKLKGIPVKVEFPVNYCPRCGKRLRTLDK